MEAAISCLREQEQDITQTAIAAKMSRSVSGLLKYPRIRVRLQQVAKQARNKVLRDCNRLKREVSLLRQVLEYRDLLSKDGTTPTQVAIAAHMGKSVSALRKYPSIRKLFNQLVLAKGQKRSE